MIKTPWTREQVESLKVGDVLQFHPYKTGKPTGWAPRPVVEITYRGDDVNGKAYVGFYQQFGPTSTISGSIKEGESYYAREAV